MSDDELVTYLDKLASAGWVLLREARATGSAAFLHRPPARRRYDAAWGGGPYIYEFL
jgi:hypothetical protein